MTGSSSQGQGSVEASSPLPFEPVGEKILYPADFEGIDELVDICWAAVEGGLTRQGYGAEKAKIHVCLHEALVNAWKHGNRRRSGRSVIFRWRFADDFTFEVQDEGKGFPFQIRTDPRTSQGLVAESGRGLYIIRVCSREVRWGQGGRHIIVSFSRP